MIYWLNHTGEVPDLLVISELFFNYKIGILLIAFGLISALLCVWIPRSRSNPGPRWQTLVIASFVYAGTYIATSIFTDEVFIALEHPYNLYHHAKFSFSPGHWVGGTVEIVYYALLTPFARTQAGLIQAAYAFGFTIGWMHVFLAWTLLNRNRFSVDLVLMLLFSLNYPLIVVFGDGFGNCLVSLVVLIGIWLRLDGRRSGFLLCAALLPLIRPDAILYSGALFASDWALSREVRWRHYAAAVIVFMAYFAIYKLLFGRWVPIPIEFKSPVLAILQTYRISDFLQPAWILADPPSFIGILLLIVYSYKKNTEIRFFVYLSVAFAGIFVFYKLTTGGISYDGRYYVGFLLVLAMIPLIFFGRRGTGDGDLGMEPVSPAGIFSGPLRGRAVLSALIIALVLQHTGSMIKHRDSVHYPSHLLGVDGYAAGGQLMERLLPAGWGVATTELNSFGFMHNREILDLWGYTNEKISRSPWISRKWRFKVAPGLFLEQRPAIYWHRTHRESTDRAISFEDMENYLLEADNLSKAMNQLGDLPKVLSIYDTCVLKYGPWSTVVLVLRERLQPFLDHLTGQGFEVVSKRMVDRSRLQALYDASGPVENHLLLFR